jgi:hypothetical protein
MLELAEALASLPQAPDRSILLAFWDAEEKEMLGSQHWIAHPTLPLGAVAAVINVDMVGRLRDNRLTLYGSRTGYGLRRLVSQQNLSAGFGIDFSWELEDDGDHYPFFKSGIPVLFLHTGIHDDFHSPRDDADYTDPEGMRRIATFLLDLVYELAQRRQAPVFRLAAGAEAESLRRRPGNGTLVAASLPDQGRVSLAAHVEGGPPRLGISFREDEAEAGTVVLTNVMPGSPAADAGLHPGDRVYDVAGSDFNGTDSFLRLVRRPGNTLELLVERDGRLSTAVLRFPTADLATLPTADSPAHR